MENQNTINNDITITGVVGKEPEYSHTSHGEKFFSFSIISKRTSEASDELNVTISERLTDIRGLTEGAPIGVLGQVRTYNQHDETRTGKPKLVVYIFAREVFDPNGEEDSNEVHLRGYICKPAIYRKTPLGREIGDILLAVNRSYHKSDYVPVICWGRNARFVETLQVGSLVELTGRIQSRIYHKTNQSTGETEERQAYEVSASLISLCEEGVMEEE